MHVTPQQSVTAQGGGGVGRFLWTLSHNSQLQLWGPQFLCPRSPLAGAEAEDVKDTAVEDVL